MGEQASALGEQASVFLYPCHIFARDMKYQFLTFTLWLDFW